MGRHVKFNSDGYEQAVLRAVDLALDKISSRVYGYMVSYFGWVDIRDIDREYMDSMLKSIRFAQTKTRESVMAQFGAGQKEQPNQSFRVVYYEHGTGKLADYPAGYSPADDPYWNPSRPRGKSFHWQRPRSSWKDMGGNWHTSNTRGTPRALENQWGRGQMIEPSHWFRRAFEDGTVGMDREILNAVKSVPITSYISIRDIYKRL